MLVSSYFTSFSLFSIRQWFAYAFLPIWGNHVVVLKEKGISKGRNHKIFLVKEQI